MTLLPTQAQSLSSATLLTSLRLGCCRVLITVPPSLTRLHLKFAYNGPLAWLADISYPKTAFQRIRPPYASLRRCLQHLPALQVRLHW